MISNTYASSLHNNTNSQFNPPPTLSYKRTSILLPANTTMPEKQLQLLV